MTSDEYNRARDTYGTLSKDQRSRVLDRVSEKTNMQCGPEAEQAFIDAVNEVQAATYCGMYGLHGGM